jgi:TatA/E family protein of Tat protein translocase
MGSVSIWHWLIVGAVVSIAFGGKGKISDIMGDVAESIKSFKKGLAEEDESQRFKQGIISSKRERRAGKNPALNFTLWESA